MRQHPAKVLYEASNYNDAFLQAAEVSPPIVITVPTKIDSPTVVQEEVGLDMEIYLDDPVESDRSSTDDEKHTDRSTEEDREPKYRSTDLQVAGLLQVVQELRQELSDFRAEANSRIDMLFEAIRRVAKNTSTGADENVIKRDVAVVLPALPLTTQEEVVTLNERLADKKFEKQMVCFVFHTDFSLV